MMPCVNFLSLLVFLIVPLISNSTTSSLTFESTAVQKHAAMRMKNRIIDIVSAKAKVKASTGPDAEQRTLADDILQHFLEFGLAKFKPTTLNAGNAYLYVILFLILSSPSFRVSPCIDVDLDGLLTL